MPIIMWYNPDLDDPYMWQRVEIYDIAYDSNGFPSFLMYYRGQWVRKSAKYFEPR